MQVTSATDTSTDTTTNPLLTADALPDASTMLSQSDFLKLLVTQMTAQDPTNPMSNQDLLAQMTQFSTLQSNTAMQTDMAQMQNEQIFSEASNLLGKQVNLQADSSTVTQGVVTGVDMQSGTPQIVVNGQDYDLSQVLSVTTASTQ